MTFDLKPRLPVALELEIPGSSIDAWPTSAAWTTAIADALVNTVGVRSSTGGFLYSATLAAAIDLFEIRAVANSTVNPGYLDVWVTIGLGGSDMGDGPILPPSDVLLANLTTLISLSETSGLNLAGVSVVVKQVTTTEPTGLSTSFASVTTSESFSILTTSSSTLITTLVALLLCAHK